MNIFSEEKNYTIKEGFKFFDLRKIIIDNFKISVGVLSNKIVSINEISDKKVFDEILSFLPNNKKTFSEMSKTAKYLIKMGVEAQFVENFMQSLSRQISLAFHTAMYSNKTIVVPNSIFLKLVKSNPIFDLNCIDFPSKAFYVAFDSETKMYVEITNFLGGVFDAKLTGAYVFDITDGIHIACVYNIEDERSIPFVGMIEWVIDKNLDYKSKSDFSKHSINPFDQMYKKEDCEKSIEEVTFIIINLMSHIDRNKSCLKFIKTSERSIPSIGKNNKNNRVVVDGFTLVED